MNRNYKKYSNTDGALLQWAHKLRKESTNLKTGQKKFTQPESERGKTK